MKSILLIGLGRFGKHIAVKLQELNHEVMAIDKDEERVNEILPYVTNAQIGDSMKEEFLSSSTASTCMIHRRACADLPLRMPRNTSRCAANALSMR